MDQFLDLWHSYHFRYCSVNNSGKTYILYNLSPVWEKPKKMDFAHKIVWKLTPEYRITPTNLVGINFEG